MKIRPTLLRTGAAIFVLSATLTATAQLRNFDGYNAHTLPRNDDGSTGLVSLGFTANFFGTSYTHAYVNNNGNITFDQPLDTYTPFGLEGTDRAIIAPFFADVDTQGIGSNPVTYGSGMLNGHAAFAVNYFNVAGYSQLSVYNTFQLVLIDRSDIAAGAFDFEFNFTDINWEAGTASGGDSQGIGGSTARIGYSSGGDDPTSFELIGSGISQYFLDSNLDTGLIHNTLGTAFDGTGVNGRYSFSVRDGGVIVIPPPGDGSNAVPEPSTYGLIGALMLAGAIAYRRRKKRG